MLALCDHFVFMNKDMRGGKKTNKQPLSWWTISSDPKSPGVNFSLQLFYVNPSECNGVAGLLGVLQHDCKFLPVQFLLGICCSASGFFANNFN